MAGLTLDVPTFPTVFGRGLISELKDIVAERYVVVTMRDLWSMEAFRKHFPEDNDPSFTVYFVESLEASSLKEDLKKMQAEGESIRCIVGLGGGQAMDVAKFFSWSLGGLMLFQVPTALTVDAPWGHRAAIRYNGVVRYVGFATPAAVYVDYDVIRSAPLRLNLSGVGDVLCFHTAHFDWKLADEDGQAGNWPYNQAMVDMAKAKMDLLLQNLSEVKNMTEDGIRVLASAFQFGGGAYHALGWNPRPLEGFDHLFFYALEHRVRKHFIHGYPVMLGIFIGSLLQGNKPEFVLDIIQQCGIDIRPEEMKITWDDVSATLLNLADFVKEKGYMYTIASKKKITPDFIEEARVMLYKRYENWGNDSK
jgi:glycerol-1-phosphate dehydrogenase [NAD(P)+]|eukprot:g795.t1